MKGKKIISCLITSVLLVNLIGCNNSSNASKENNNEVVESKFNETYNKMDDILDSICEDEGINGLSYRIESGDGEFSWNHSSGNMNDDTEFAIASITKMYTTTVILSLVYEGKINIDDNIDKYLDNSIVDGLNVYEGVDYSHEITVRQLLTHTSGLPDYYTEGVDGEKSIEEYLDTEGDIYYDFDKVLSITKSLKSHFAPGSEGQAYYSDGNYQLLGKIIENITNEDLSKAYEKYIYTPLNLKNTYLFEKDMKWDNIQLVEFERGLEGRTLVQASERSTGGLISNTKDIMVFLKAFWNGELFDKSHYEEMENYNDIQFYPIKYGMGNMYCNYKYPLKGHSGSLGTMAFYCPDKDLYIVGTINNNDTKQVIDIAYNLIDCY